MSETPEDVARRAICDAARHLYARGHNAPGDGNVSVRVAGGRLLCTPSGVHKGRLEPDAIVAVDLTSGEALGPGAASSELRLHLLIYRARPDVGAVVHAHSPHATGLTVAGVSLARPVVPEAILALGGVPTVPYACPTTAEVPDGVRAVLPEAQGFLLERHGPVALGRDLDEAVARLEIIEHTARITVAALSAGNAKPLAARDHERLREMARAAGRLPPEG